MSLPTQSLQIIQSSSGETSIQSRPFLREVYDQGKKLFCANLNSKASVSSQLIHQSFKFTSTKNFFWSIECYRSIGLSSTDLLLLTPVSLPGLQDLTGRLPVLGQTVDVGSQLLVGCSCLVQLVPEHGVHMLQTIAPGCRGSEVRGQVEGIAVRPDHKTRYKSPRQTNLFQGTRGEVCKNSQV